MPRLLCATLVLLLATLGSAAPVSAQNSGAGPLPAAREAFEAGRDAYERGRFGEALAHYERAYDLSPSPGLLFNIARAADSDGQSERARAAYGAYLEAAPNAENREFVQARLQKLSTAPQPEASSPSSVPPSAQASAPGPRLSPASSRPVESTSLGATSVTPDVRPATTRSYWRSAWFWTAVGVALAAGTTAAIVVARHDDPAHAAADLRVKTLVQP